MLVVRGTAMPGPDGSVPPCVADAAREALGRSIADGKPLSRRESARRFESPGRGRVSSPGAVAASANGHVRLDGSG